jgi:uncharacterized protein YjiS (DUF1127 family)
MREYVLTQAQARQAFGRWTTLVHMLKNWRRRRDLNRLLAVDEFLLGDLGIERERLNQLVARRLSADWAWESEQAGRVLTK